MIGWNVIHIPRRSPINYTDHDINIEYVYNRTYGLPRGIYIDDPDTFYITVI